MHTFHGHVLRGYFGPVSSGFFRMLERSLASTTTALVAVSPEVRDDLVALGVAPREKFTVIRLGVELEERVSASAETRARARRMMGIPDGRFTVGWIGRMTAVKRTDDILLAFKRLRGRATSTRACASSATARIAKRPRSSPTTSASSSAASSSATRTTWRRSTPRSTRSCCRRRTRARPSASSRRSPAGRPVVATRVGGVPDVVRDGVDGFLVEPGDIDALAERLGRLAADPALAARMGEAGRARVLERYSVERLVGDVDALYRKLLAEKGLADGRA